MRPTHWGLVLVFTGLGLLLVLVLLGVDVLLGWPW